ncbi:hypothetical protein MTO96_016579 [Rhipicephalus appendiculatus]
MQERVQQSNESTTAYFRSMVRVCQEVNLDFNDTREQVLAGLRSRELCTMLLGRTHEDDDDLLHDILEFEAHRTRTAGAFRITQPKHHVTIIFGRSLPATMTREENIGLEPWNGSTPAIALHQSTR